MTHSSPSDAASARPVSPLSLLIATPDHADQITSLHAAAFGSGWDKAAITALLEAETAIAFMATEDQARTPIGFVIGRLAGLDGEIISIGVRPQSRRQGRGTALLAGFCRAAQIAGANRAVFEVAVSNTAALALYTGHGFAEAGRRPEYYGGEGAAREDALVLAKSLAEAP